MTLKFSCFQFLSINGIAKKNHNCMSELFYNADLTEVGRKKVRLNIPIINIKTEVFL